MNPRSWTDPIDTEDIITNHHCSGGGHLVGCNGPEGDYCLIITLADEIDALRAVTAELAAGPSTTEIKLAKTHKAGDQQRAAGSGTAPCPTCQGWNRETTDMVCMTCGRDYLDEHPVPGTGWKRLMKGWHARAEELETKLAKAIAETNRVSTNCERFENKVNAVLRYAREYDILAADDIRRLIADTQ